LLAFSLIASNLGWNKQGGAPLDALPPASARLPTGPTTTHLLAVIKDFLVADTVSCIQQGTALLRRLSSTQYVAPQPDCFNSTLGGHIRHNLDHYACFLNGLPAGRVDYDDRDRDALVETDPGYAAGRLEDAASRLGLLASAELIRELAVKTDTGSEIEAAQAWTRSTGRRELQFLLSHTIHHYALIAVICNHLGVPLDPAFGVAPSTLRFQQQQGVTCAR
jgi:hypothetical protein